MKTYDFPFNLELGKCDVVDGMISFELDEDQQKRLIASAKTGKYARLDEDESIQDIYDGVLLQFLDDERAALDPETIIDYFDLESEDDVTDEVIDEYMDDFYGAALSIYYPAELLN